MSTRTLFLCCLALAVLPAAHAALTKGLSCGALLPGVAAHCGHPAGRDARGCCAALRDWNDAACWCEPAALAALSRVAGNELAFSGRAAACNITTMLRPTLHSRLAAARPSTCPSVFVNVSAHARDAGHECTILPTALREARLATLNILDNLTLASAAAADLAQFNASLAAILEPFVAFANVGQIDLFGAPAAIDYLLARQAALGCSAPLRGSAAREMLFWRDAASASYALAVGAPGRTLGTRFVFAGFSPCSAKLRAVYMLESEFVAAEYAQYYYSKGAADVVGQFNVTAQVLCGKIAQSCTGAVFPYASVAECVAAMQALKRAKKVMCNGFSQAYVPQLALHGDSIACRSTFAAVAKLKPGVYCPLLGPNATGICAEKACPRGLYDDIFTAQNPRHDGSGGGFLCKRSTGECVERWP